MLTAIGLDSVVLVAFAVMKWQRDPVIVVIALSGMAAVFAFEWVFLRFNPPSAEIHHDAHTEARDQAKSGP